MTKGATVYLGTDYRGGRHGSVHGVCAGHPLLGSEQTLPQVLHILQHVNRVASKTLETPPF